MLRLGGLDDHRSRLAAAAGAASDLRHQLERPLAGPEVGVVQQVVCIQNAYEGHASEIESFRNDLRADQNVGPPLLERLHDPAVSAADCDVSASSRSIAASGKMAASSCSIFSVPNPRGSRLPVPARRAYGRYGDPVAAIVAAERAVALMISQRHVAVGAVGGPAAVTALDVRRKAPPVLEQDRLTARPATPRRSGRAGFC